MNEGLFWRGQLAARTLAARLADIASAGGVSRETIRTQLGRVMEKTGCNRQADVSPPSPRFPLRG
jgi:DNA-binding CsgD family transcriptional regulator